MTSPVTPGDRVLRLVAIRIEEEPFLCQKTSDLHFAGGGSHAFPERFKDLDVGGREEPLYKFRRIFATSAIGIATNSVIALASEPIAEDGLADRRRPRWRKRGPEVP